MSAWTEQSLREAASWKAFKEGRALLDSGAVAEATAVSGGWRGAVRSGSRLIRLSATVRGPTDIEARCPCAENRATGMLCGHAVAVGLAALAVPGSSPREAPSSATPAKPAPALPSRPTAAVAPTALCFTISFPPNWRESLARGRLGAALGTCDGDPSPADVRLAAWLAEQGAAPAPMLHLQLDRARAAAFLEAAIGHPRVGCPSQSGPIEIIDGQRIAIADILKTGDRVIVSPEPTESAWVELGGSYWIASPEGIARAGVGGLPAGLRQVVGRLAGGKSAEIPVSDLLSNLAEWQRWLWFPENSWLEELHFVPALARFQLALDGNIDALDATLRFIYSGCEPVSPGAGYVEGLPRLSGSLCETRDLETESRAIRQLESAGFRPVEPAAGRWRISGESAVLDFLAAGLPSFRDPWEIVEGTRFGNLRNQVVRISPKIEIRASGENWLDFNLSFQTNDGKLVSAEEVRKILGSSSRSKAASGKRLVIGNEFSETIEPLFAELDLRQHDGCFEARGGAVDLILNLRNNLQKSISTNEFREEKAFQKPAGLRATLRPYQEQGAAWLCDRLRRHGGAILADDMGLGKTIQTIAAIECFSDEVHEDSGVVMVVATTSLLGNWRAEIARFAPARTVHVLHGAQRDAVRERVGPGDVVLTSFGTLARDLAWHLRCHYRLVVVDEASLMRNPDTDHAKALCKLRASFRIALTGTPIENGVRDLWSIFRFVQPGWLGGREEFRGRYEQPLAEGQAARAVMERLRFRVHPFLLRRTKDQVASDLPSKLVIDDFCDLSKDQQAVYRDLLQEARKRVDEATDSGNQGAARMRMLTALLRLRQTCNDLSLLGNDRLKQLDITRRSCKIERLLERLDEAISGGHKVLVFSQFQKQLLEIEKCVLERNWRVLRLDGQSRNRQSLVDEFQSAEGPPVFLISLKAGGYGLNLTAADIVIHFDPWWNPAAEAQATDRAHRIGQTRPVTVYRLLTRGTVEEKVVRLQAGKKALAAAIDEFGSGDPSGWSMKELEEVIS